MDVIAGPTQQHAGVLGQNTGGVEPLMCGVASHAALTLTILPWQIKSN